MLRDLAEYPARREQRSDAVPVGVVVLDACRAADSKPPRDVADHGFDDGQTVDATEQRGVRVVIHDLRLQLRAFRDVRRIGHDQIDAALEPWQQVPIGDITLMQMDRCITGGLAVGSITTRPRQGGGSFSTA